MCNLPFTTVNHSFEKEVNMQVNTSSTGSAMEARDFEEEYANEDLPNSQMNWIVEERKNNANSAFVAHLNINSIQNKFEELKLLNDLLKAQIFIVSETKIDRSYPDDQFRLQGYQMYRRDGPKEEVVSLLIFLQLCPRRD